MIVFFRMAVYNHPRFDLLHYFSTHDFLILDTIESIIAELATYFFDLQPIGSGAHSVIYSGYDPIRNRTIAIKILPPELQNNPHRIARFNRERRIIESIYHLHIPDFYPCDFPNIAEKVIFMEYLKGHTLEDHLRSFKKTGIRPNVRLMMGILAQTLAPLGLLHSRNIIHRDLAPKNIFLTSCLFGTYPLVKILDFGLAKIVNEPAPPDQKVTNNGEVLGTPLYMSPEQISGDPVTPASDIYSLGVIMYEMFTGKHPFGEGEEAAKNAYNAHLFEPFPNLPEQFNKIENLNRVIQGCTRKQPKERIRQISQIVRLLGMKRRSS